MELLHAKRGRRDAGFAELTPRMPVGLGLQSILPRVGTDGQQLLVMGLGVLGLA
jgi:hypothetical protein